MDMLEDPYMLLYFAPVVLAVLYFIVSLFGESGE
jgi:hypothetical protein